MKWIQCISAFLLLIFQANAQVHYDSINNKDFLYENSYLSSSNNILFAYSKGVSIEHITVSESEAFRSIKKDSIISIELKENRLNILVYKKDAGCKKFLFEISIEDDSVLHLRYYDFGNPCMSSSNYTFNYNLILDKSNIEKLKLIKYVMLNDNFESRRKLKLL